MRVEGETHHKALGIVLLSGPREARCLKVEVLHVSVHDTGLSPRGAPLWGCCDTDDRAAGDDHLGRCGLEVWGKSVWVEGVGSVWVEEVG